MNFPVNLTNCPCVDFGHIILYFLKEKDKMVDGWYEAVWITSKLCVKKLSFCCKILLTTIVCTSIPFTAALPNGMLLMYVSCYSMSMREVFMTQP